MEGGGGGWKGACVSVLRYRASEITDFLGSLGQTSALLLPTLKCTHFTQVYVYTAKQC